MELLISKGADVSVVDDERQTPLNLASMSGNTKAARQLIDRGADISHETTAGFTPLSMASSRGHVELAKLLIKRGADVNQVVANGPPPLLLAVCDDHSELAELLIDEGAERTGIQIQGQVFSLLAMAAGYGHLNTAKALISKGFNPTEAQPLLLAASYGSYSGFSRDFIPETATTSPDFPCLAYHQVLELLLQSGADVNTSDVRGYTPLYMASLGGFIDIVEILTQKGAGLNVKTVAGETPLHASSAMGHLRVTQLLIQHGADAASKDNSGRNPLHYACSSQTQTLDEADHWGSTPLSLAARFGGVGILMALIDTGAVEVESSDMFGRTTTWWATSHNYDAVARLLAGTDGHRDLGTDVEEGEAVQEQGLEMGTYCDICWLFISGQTHYWLVDMIFPNVTTASQLPYSLLHYRIIGRTCHQAIKMKLISSLLTTLLAGSMVSAKYTVEIPDDAVWVTNWDELHAAPRFEGVLLPKYGGFVIEVDEKIVLATNERMSKEVFDLLTDLEKNDPQPEDEQQTPNKRDTEIREIHEPTDPEATCCSSEDGIAYKDLSPEQKEISDILRNMDRDPDLMGLADLGKDGVFRFLDADRNIHYAVPLRPALIKALIDRLPYDPEVEKFWRGVDGTKVPEEQWYNPPEGILPPPLAEEERREEREIMEKNKDKIDKIRGDLKNGIHRERLVFIESDNKLE
ncbi:ankyrin repeat-containing domain protein [Fusarium oxysporum f. sp. albedinis]|nr:ankyrin repeat-containing domain protein [Fusarium oxysporum f. sp. albedinis]